MNQRNDRPKNSGRRRRPPRGHQRHRPRSSQAQAQRALGPGERLFDRHTQLIEAHNQARGKYFEMYYRADPQQKDKLEKQFDRTLLELRQFEEALSPQDKEMLFKDKGRSHMDHTYSSNHDLDTKAPKVDENLSEEPHVLESQKNCDFSQDSEESVGTLEDYLEYKGGVPVREQRNGT